MGFGCGENGIWFSFPHLSASFHIFNLENHFLENSRSHKHTPKRSLHLATPKARVRRAVNSLPHRCHERGPATTVSIGKRGSPSTFDGCYYARDADDLLLGFMGAVELLNEIQRIAHSIDGLWVDSAGEIARSTEFLGTVILREVPPKTPIQFFREQEKRLRVKHRIQLPLRPLIPMPFLRARGDPTAFRCPFPRGEKGYTAFGSLDTLAVGTAVRQQSSFMSNPPVTYEGTPGKAHLLKVNLLSHSGRIIRSTGSLGKLWYESGAVRTTPRIEFPTQAEAPITKILLRLRDRGLISSRPWPIHVAFMNVSDGEDIVNWSAGIAISPLSYYRCRDNLYQVRTIVDHQIRWSAIFTLAHKQKSSGRKIL